MGWDIFRASVLSKLGGFYYGGIAIGPVLGSTILHALDIPMPSKLLSLFCLALLSNSVALVYVTFILPESLDSEERERLRMGREARMKKRAECSGSRMVEASRRFYVQYPGQLFRWLQIFFKFLAPLAVLAPKKTGALNPNEATGIRRKSFWRWDWDLTLIGLALWCGYLSMVRTWQSVRSNAITYATMDLRVSTRINTCLQSMSMVGHQSRYVNRLTVNIPVPRI